MPFGDSNNDLPMFQCVATPIARGSSPQTVREAAVYTTGTVLEDGILEAPAFWTHLSPIHPTQSPGKGPPLMLQQPDLLVQPAGIAGEASSAPTTRWQGMIREMGLCPTAPPTA